MLWRIEAEIRFRSRWERTPRTHLHSKEFLKCSEILGYHWEGIRVWRNTTIPVSAPYEGHGICGTPYDLILLVMQYDGNLFDEFNLVDFPVFLANLVGEKLFRISRWNFNLEDTLMILI